VGAVEGGVGQADVGGGWQAATVEEGEKAVEVEVGVEGVEVVEGEGERCLVAVQRERNEEFARARVE
jgi:hypothetical protein